MKVIYRGGLRPGTTIVDPAGLIAPIEAPYVAAPSMVGAVTVPERMVASLLAAGSGFEAADAEAAEYVPLPRVNKLAVKVRSDNGGFEDENGSPLSVGSGASVAEWSAGSAIKTGDLRLAPSTGMAPFAARQLIRWTAANGTTGSTFTAGNWEAVGSASSGGGSRNIDGGSASSTYLPSQIINGGGANG